mmetsp:Transcript_23379/g.36034  ORF Transcript_23379/g.36034 Transcript_23379/m.36034 type:complete len:222 (-) Transcript_23379:2325-2990(-)
MLSHVIRYGGIDATKARNAIGFAQMRGLTFGACKPLKLNGTRAAACLGRYAHETTRKWLHLKTLGTLHSQLIAILKSFLILQSRCWDIIHQILIPITGPCAHVDAADIQTELLRNNSCINPINHFTQAADGRQNLLLEVPFNVRREFLRFAYNLVWMVGLFDNGLFATIALARGRLVIIISCCLLGILQCRIITNDVWNMITGINDLPQIFEHLPRHVHMR